MTSERWGRLKKVFAAAVDLDLQQRDRLLAREFGDEPDMVAQARRLLASHDEAGDFLSSPGLQESVPTESQPMFTPGQIIAGRFAVTRFIARGGMGEVYEAKDSLLGKSVALKTVSPQLATATGLDMLRSELEATRRVTHPNVCRTYDMVEHGDPPVLVLTMELVEGPTLSAFLREYGPLPRREALSLIAQIASGLQAAHDAGVIHRDFKSGNVMLVDPLNGRRPVITDFGLALPSDAAREEPHHVRGTPGYMAPEQLDGRPVTPATDVYALGIVIQKIIGAQADRGKLGRWRSVVERCLRDNPAARYQRPAEVVAALHRVRFLGRAALAAVALAFAATLAVLAVRHFRPSDKPWLLVTAVEGGSGDPLVDTTVPFLLDREIGDVSQLRVAPPSRVQDTLRLMRRDPESRIDVPLARDISARDADIGLVARPSVARVGTGYEIAAEVIDAGSGRRIGRPSAQAGTREAVPASVHVVALAIGRIVGGARTGGIPKGRGLLRVTTASLLACQLYSKALDTSLGLNWRAVETLARQAIAEDPQFASGHLLLAWSLIGQCQACEGRKEALTEVERAAALSETVSDQERQTILATRLQVKGQLEEAAAAWRRILSAYPPDPRVHGLLREALLGLGRSAEYTLEMYQAAELWPRNFFLIAETRDYAVRWGDLKRARSYQERLDGLLKADPSRRQEKASAIASFRLHDLWLRDKVEELKAALDHMVRPGPMTWREAIPLIIDYDTLGRFHDAQNVISHVPKDLQRGPLLMLAYLRDSPASVASVLKELHPQGAPASLLEIRPEWTAGQFDEFLHGIAGRNLWVDAILKSRFLALHGDLTGAEEALGDAERAGTYLSAGWNESFMAQEMLAHSLEVAGKDDSALRTLVAADIGPIRLMPIAAQAAFWQRIRYERGRLLRKVGRRQEAESIEADLKRELRLADSDHPILVHLAAANRSSLHRF